MLVRTNLHRLWTFPLRQYSPLLFIIYQSYTDGHYNGPNEWMGRIEFEETGMSSKAMLDNISRKPY